MSFLDHALISQRYFFPNDDRVSNLREIQTRDGCKLQCGYLQGRSSRTVVHFHGNGETASDGELMLGAFFVDCGWSVVFVEYRGYGGSDGVPQLAGMLSDGEDVVQALGLAPETVVAFGRSIGSLYAVELARRLPIAGLILESGINDLLERVLLRVTPDELGVSQQAVHQEVTRVFDQSGKLRTFPGPVLILHASDDQLVEVSHAQENAKACRHPTLRQFDHGGHNGLYHSNLRAYQAVVRQFLEEVVRLSESLPHSD